ncbi:MFS transporter [Anaerotardibacter muris]|uniref:MFS transporter n=1 Tax=Anaerotardibacter muris TaxID=2941505 RepID=UPI00203BC080|nr:MFS transporter [Anaerotardibacter muris]
METTAKKETIWSLPFIILMAVNLFQSMAAFMAGTTLPLYIDSMGATTGMIGIVVSSFTVTALLIRPFAGPAFDSFSRKWLLIASQAITCMCLFLYGVVDTLEALIVVRLFHGIGIGCGGPLAMSLVSEFLPKAKFASGISIYALAQSVAQVIGPAVGLYLIDAIGFSVTYASAAACVLVAIMGILLIKEPYHERLKYELKLDRMFAPQAVGKGVALMLLATSFSCMTSYVVLYGYSVGVEQMSLFFVIYALCLFVTRPLFGSLADRFGTPRLLAVGILFFASSYIALSFANSLPGFILAAVLGSAGFGCCAPLLQSLALASVPISRRGAASNTTFTGMDLGTLLGPIIGGFVVESLEPAMGSLSGAYSSMWLVMLIPAIGTLLISIYWLVKQKIQTSPE